jgi:alkanesulfonate monooxygenase SsuD/methylene tetrahydromethanopterin reductase-like flavin-dependent oxidoreductase (luciferase family)
MREFAQCAEAAGFDSLWVSDHLLDDGNWSLPAGMVFPARRGGAVGFWECWTLLSALAEATDRLELGPLVACTSYRNPALLAQMANTLDEISGGRVILGLGAGDHWGEHRAFGFQWERRVARFEEALAIIAPALKGGPVDSSGITYSAHFDALRPAGPRPGGPPILIGALGTGPRMLSLTARYADMWNGFLVWDPDPLARLPALRASVDAACEAEGRDPRTLERTLAVGMAIGTASSRLAINGDVETLSEALAAIAAEGITHIQLHLEPATPAGIEAFASVLERLDALA